MIQNFLSSQVWRRIGPTLGVAVALALGTRFVEPAPPPRTLDGLAALLGQATGGTVQPSDVAWEPSPGVLAEFVWGRRVLFLSSVGGAPRDLYRARVRVTLEGRPVTISGLHNLTATPFGDEQKLIIYDTRAAFATATSGAIESITLLDLGGKPRAPGSNAIDDVTSSITNWQETGDGRGIGRIDVNIDKPGDELALAFDRGSLVISMGAGKRMAVELATGVILGEEGGVGAHVYVPPALRKRPILWAVDTVRAEVGPEPVAMVEAAVFNARDVMRRQMYSWFGAKGASPVASDEPALPPPPKTVDAAHSQNDPNVWPPPPIPVSWKSPEPGEGKWVPVTYPWLKRFSARSSATAASVTTASEPPPYFYLTTVRSDPERPYTKVMIVAMDMRQLELDMEAGVDDPKPLTGVHGSGKIPRDPKVLGRVVGAFNGAFKTTHGEYGMMVHRRVLLPPKPAAATVLVTDDRRVGLGTWPASPKLPSDVLSFRQNLEPLVEDGKVSPSGRTQWGWQLQGTSMMTERSGLCVSEGGHLYYLWGDEVSAATLGKAMLLARCTYGIHLDMNPHHTGFVFANVRSVAPRDYEARLLTPLMEIWPERYLEYSPKDFFYLMLREPAPSGDVGWVEDVGAQPAPPWLPAVWRTLVQVSPSSPDTGPVQVELLAFDNGRVSWRLRTARREWPKREFLSAELDREDSHKVMAAVGLGNPQDPREAQNTKLSFPNFPTGALIADESHGLALVSEQELGPGDGSEAIIVPFIAESGKIVAAAREQHAMRRRAAACLAPSGHAVIATATSDSDEATAMALLRVGCTRVAALDRGSHRSTFLHRAGAGSAPLARYDESVIYAVSHPMASRSYRWSPQATLTPAAPVAAPAVPVAAPATTQALATTPAAAPTATPAPARAPASTPTATPTPARAPAPTATPAPARAPASTPTAIPAPPRAPASAAGPATPKQ